MVVEVSKVRQEKIDSSSTWRGHVLIFTKHAAQSPPGVWVNVKKKIKAHGTGIGSDSL